jgi:hypothetical protein
MSETLDNNAARLELWERMAKAIIRAYNKLPMTKHNVELNKELSELAEKVRELEPPLKVYYPLD